MASICACLDQRCIYNAEVSVVKLSHAPEAGIALVDKPNVLVIVVELNWLMRFGDCHIMQQCMQAEVHPVATVL